jgi:hypothetical protein
MGLQKDKVDINKAKNLYWKQNKSLREVAKFFEVDHGTIKQLGNECIRCGVPATAENIVIFDFHHRNPSEKHFDISGLHKSINCEDFKNEIKKCDLVCSNCHRMIHFMD